MNRWFSFLKSKFVTIKHLSLRNTRNMGRGQSLNKKVDTTQYFPQRKFNAQTGFVSSGRAKPNRWLGGHPDVSKAGILWQRNRRRRRHDRSQSLVSWWKLEPNPGSPQVQEVWRPLEMLPYPPSLPLLRGRWLPPTPISLQSEAREIRNRIPFYTLLG